MIYAIAGFVFGFLIPYISRRFQKFMPATAAYGIYRIVMPNKCVPIAKRRSNKKYRKLFSKYIWRSVVWGLIASVLSYAALHRFGETNIGWHLLFIYILLLLVEIDYKMFLLPDILTVPLLIFGFTYAALAGQWVGVGESAIGALVGYFLPVIASLFIVWKNSDAFGGGDIKLLAAVGAWMGLYNVIYVMIVSSVIFAVYALVRKKRDGAFGPAIVISALMIAFWSL